LENHGSVAVALANHGGGEVEMIVLQQDYGRLGIAIQLITDSIGKNLIGPAISLLPAILYLLGTERVFKKVVL
jgi:hypothetical protein